jgi:hypothetical protein
VSLDYPSRFSPGADPASQPNTSAAPQSDERDIPSDLKLAWVTGANVLLVGPAGRVEDLVALHLRDVTADLVIQCQDAPPPLPPASSPVGPVVLRDVDFLTPPEQRRLSEWLDSTTNRIQVVSTASAPLLPLVDAGAFNDALYYRLNTVYIDLSE